MTAVTIWDAGNPPGTGPGGTEGNMIYAVGANAEHIWTDQEIEHHKGRYRLPVAVYGREQNGARDAEAMNAWLDKHGAPSHCAVLLDMETSVDAPYVHDFDAALENPLWLYGSISTVFANPPVDGWFVANPTGHLHLYAHPDVAGTQYAWAQLDQTAGPWDLSLIAPAYVNLLWDTRPADQEFIAPGDMSIQTLARQLDTGVSTILRLSAERQKDGKFTPEQAAYIDSAAFPFMPRGLTLRVPK